MFKIDGFVEDKHVAKLMHAVAGLVDNFKCVPVVNAVKAPSGKMVQETAGGSMAEVVSSKVKQLSSGATVSAAQIKTFIVEAGGVESSSSYFNKYLIDNGVMKHIANRRGYYKVQ